MQRARTHRMFAELSADLAKITPNYPVQVGCPLCLRTFTEDAIDLEEPELTEEHIIPEELGGKIVTLTCKTCNNVHGAKIDAHLIQMMRSRDTMEGFGKRPFRGSIKVSGMTVPTDVDWKAFAGETTTFRLRKFKPGVHDAIRAEMRKGTVETINVHFSFDYIPARANIALLRAGYLAMFQRLGYSYILNPTLAVMREIINTYENYREELGQFVGEVGSDGASFKEPLHFIPIQGGIAVMVVMTLKTDAKRHYAAFLPSPELQPGGVLATLGEAAKSIAPRPAITA